MKPEKLAAEVRAYCKSHQDAVQAQRYARFFTEGYDAWGIGKDDPFWTEKMQKWLAAYAGLGLPGFLKAGEIMIGSGKYEEGMMAIRLAAAFRDKMDSTTMPRLAVYFEAGLCNWAYTDVFAGEISAPLLQSGAIPLEAFAPWRFSPLKYQRRCVPVSMLGLLKTSTPIPPLLDFLRPLMMDAEKVVQQGTGWFLRDTWKKEPKPVEVFLLEWKDKSPRVIYQYATEKMTAAAKERFRRVKK